MTGNDDPTRPSVESNGAEQLASPYVVARVRTGSQPCGVLVAADKVWEFAFFGACIKLRGATGSPMRPVAMPLVDSPVV